MAFLLVNARGCLVYMLFCCESRALNRYYAPQATFGGRVVTSFTIAPRATTNSQPSTY